MSSQVGRLDSDKPAAIRLSGDNILEEHCYFENTEGRVMIYSIPESITVRPSPFLCSCNMQFILSRQFLNGKQLTPGQVRFPV
jgi:kinesin family protein 1